jgi:hypothetical protein
LLEPLLLSARSGIWVPTPQRRLLEDAWNGAVLLLVLQPLLLD